MTWAYELEKAWITLKVWGLKTKFMLIRVVALFGILAALFGAYAAIRPDLLIPASSVTAEYLPTITDVRPFDGILLFFAGIIIAALTTRT